MTAGVDGFWNILCGSNLGFTAAGAGLSAALMEAGVLTDAACAAAAPAATLPKLFTFSSSPRWAPVVGFAAGDELITESGLSIVPKLSAGFLAGVAVAATLAGGVGMLTALEAVTGAASAAGFRGCPA